MQTSGSAVRKDKESNDSIGFSCALSMENGLVNYITPNVTTTLGFAKEMWIGRSFKDFIHPEDQKTFTFAIVNELQARTTHTSGHLLNIDSVNAWISNCKLGVRFRLYKSLSAGFGIREREVSYKPFLLKFSIKTNKEHNFLLLVEATPIYSAYTTPNEYVSDAKLFVIKHSAKGIIQSVSMDVIPYLGHFPQDLVEKDALLLYHPDDLPLLKEIYAMILKEGNVSKSMPVRMLTNNGDYVKVETEWMSCANPWLKTLEFVVGNHSVVMGPAKPDVFLSAPPAQQAKLPDDVKAKMQTADINREIIRVIMQQVMNTQLDESPQQVIKCCEKLVHTMPSALQDESKLKEQMSVGVLEPPQPDAFFKPENTEPLTQPLLDLSINSTFLDTTGQGATWPSLETEEQGTSGREQSEPKKPRSNVNRAVTAFWWYQY